MKRYAELTGNCKNLEIKSSKDNKLGLIDEVREHDGSTINSVVLPLMNVSRRLPTGDVNPLEPNQQSIFVTSAGDKISFAYDRLIDTFGNSIITPETSFSFSCDYRIPVKHGILEPHFIQELRMSPSFSEEDFSREYLSLWSGGSSESWFGFEKLQKYRTIKNPETVETMLKRKSKMNEKNVIKSGEESKFFYLTSTDVARLRDQTAVVVFKVFPGITRFTIAVVNVIILGRDAQSKTFTRQALDLKKIISAYDSKHNVIDLNGLGVGLGDMMIRDSYDDNGELYPALGFYNDDEYKKTQPRSAEQILYGIKASANLNSEIHGNTHSRFTNGSIRFLISEKEAKTYLLASDRGKQMSPYERVERLLPHEMTTKLFLEMGNLKLKRTTGTNITLEQINLRYPKDTYSALSYGLWRIKELEEDFYKRIVRKGSKPRKLTFFTGGR